MAWFGVTITADVDLATALSWVAEGSFEQATSVALASAARTAMRVMRLSVRGRVMPGPPAGPACMSQRRAEATSVPARARGQVPGRTGVARRRAQRPAQIG